MDVVSHVGKNPTAKQMARSKLLAAPLLWDVLCSWHTQIARWTRLDCFDEVQTGWSSLGFNRWMNPCTCAETSSPPRAEAEAGRAKSAGGVGGTLRLNLALVPGRAHARAPQ